MLKYHENPSATGGPGTPVHPRAGNSGRVARRRRVDRVARVVVMLGGMAVIVSIVAILFVIVAEMAPLFGTSSLQALSPVSLQSATTPLAVGTDEYQDLAWVVGSSGVDVFSMSDGSAIPGSILTKSPVTAVTPMVQGTFALGLGNGTFLQVCPAFSQKVAKGRGKTEPAFRVDPPVALEPAGRPVRFLAHARTDSGSLTVSASATKELSFLRREQKKSLLGNGKVVETRRAHRLAIDEDIAALAIDCRGEDLFVGLSDGRLIRMDLRNPDAPSCALPMLGASRPGAALTALGFLNGDRTLLVGDASGGVSSWQVLRSEEGSRYLVQMNRFEGHEAPITGFSCSLRNKGFLSVDARGGIRLHYATTGRTLEKASSGGEPVTAAWTPKGDGIVAVGVSGKAYRWEVRSPHPETTLGSLFGSTWYEGYAKAEAVWQSTGGTDDFEPKFGLIPLIYGTLKGTFYALILAVPLSLLSALYVSQFMHPAIKQNIKPVIEVMAALPSVVLGFISALWLAPNIERQVPGLLLMPFVTSALILSAVAAWRSVPLSFRQRFKHGSEVALIIPVVLTGAALSFSLGATVETSMLGGDYQAWFLRVLGLSYDQRNSVVVGLAMGFAVIPIIFTIAEDSLSNVPPYLAAGSLALGATRWQTALKVVLPSASPGIFSAIMIGFGRAVGETMIVLMATGNTPVMNWNPFKGFRALSANIAVELPEAPEGGTLFRVLFLAAFLLFLMTFAVNTAAELVRIRLRKKFQSL